MAFISCFAVTPVFGKKLYNYLMNDDVPSKKSHQQSLLDDQIRRTQQLLEGISPELRQDIERLSKQNDSEKLSEILWNIHMEKMEKAAEFRRQKAQQKQKLHHEYIECIKAEKREEANAIKQALFELYRTDNA